MKTPLLTTVFSAFFALSFGQTTTQLNANNVNATISDDGHFFNNSQSSSPGYEVPDGSGINAIFTGSFWFGGTDVNGQLKLAAPIYAGSGQDYWTGPATRYNGSEWALNNWSTIQDYFGQTLWTVTKDEINDHIANYQSSTYTMPADIQNWPAHGDTSLGNYDGMLPYIAPFVDVNSNGVYDPVNGDYPCIKGDQATYLIMSDLGGLHTASQGGPIGIELHYMFYQFNSVPELANTTFFDVEVVNMGTQTLYDTHASFFLDTDLGNYADDYIGTDTLRNMVYAYNADNVDETNGGQLGYGTAPPAIGLKLLSHNLTSSIAFSNGMGSPTSAAEYYQNMRGNLSNGSDQLDGLGNSTDYFYYGDPNVSNSWSEYQQGTVPSDRRMLASTNIGTYTPDMTYGAVDRKTFSYAIIYAQGSDNLNSVSELQTSADFIQSYFDNMTNNCFDIQFASIPEKDAVEFSVYPNPNSGNFTIQLPTTEKATATIIDAQGRVVHSQSIGQGMNTIDVLLESGVYFVQVEANATSSITRMVVR